MKWIRASHLDSWARTIDSRVYLSELVSDLIRASAVDIRSFRFPTGDSAQAPGYDGTLEATGVPPFVPDGKSVWEFGNAADYLSKAKGDYENRSNNPRSATPNETTFVFVTALHWKRDDPTLEEWSASKRAERKWKDVRAIDAVALEEWLERCPGVAARTARQILSVISANGARSTDEFWEEYSLRLKPPLTEAVLLCDRGEQAKVLLQQLLGEPDTHLWQADSSEEVVAFAVAAIRSGESEVRKFLESRTVIVDTKEAAQQLCHQSNLVFLPVAGALGSEGQLSKKNPTLVPLGREGPKRSGATLLNRPLSFSLTKALETMGFKPQEAAQRARMCGRSVTILARLIPSGTAKKPEWDGKQELLPAMLAGAWDSASKEDQEVVRALAGASNYGEYEHALLPYLQLQDAPLEREGSIWKVRAPVDMFVHLGCLLGDTELERLSGVAKEVFSEIDPSLELAPTEGPYAALTGKKLKHSEWVRDGLATTLLQLAVFHDEARVQVPGTAEAFVNRIIKELPGLSRDWRLLASLRDQLPILMEAAPRPLLSTLGHLLEGDGGLIRPIFRDVDPLFSSSPHTGLLWALELVAWDPEYLSASTLLLAKLARIDPGGKLANRPLASLRGIFLPWHPGTNATLRQRLGALDAIARHEPEIGWKLLLSLLPVQHDFTGESSKPRYREAGASEKEMLTRQLVWEGYQEMMQRAMELAHDEAGRWAALVPSVPRFGPPQFARACELLREYSARATEGQRAVVWAAAKELANHHRAFREAAWAMREPELASVESIVDMFTPADPVTVAAWLFDQDHRIMPGEGGGSPFEALRRAREASVLAVYEALGQGGVVSLAERAGQPRQVGAPIPFVIPDVGVWDGMIDSALGKSEKLDEFALAVSTSARARSAKEWEERIRIRFHDGRATVGQVAMLIRYWDDERSTWTFAMSLGAEVEASYWKGKHIWPLTGTVEGSVFAIRKYESFGRAVSAIDAIALHADAIPYEVLFQLLDRAMEELNSKQSAPSGIDSYDIVTLFESLRRHPDAPKVEIARREFAYLPFFPYGETNLSLHELMAESPEFFVEVLCTVFKAASGERQEPTRERRALANVGYRLLSQFHIVPGVADGQIKADELKAWVARVRELAKGEDRAQIADEYVGHVIAYAPGDPDGTWPHRTIRDLIEDSKSQWVESGVLVERANMRGVVTKAMYEGGNQERTLASQAREWAAASVAWPRTHAMLLKLADMWEVDASYEDQRARQDEMRFE